MKGGTGKTVCHLCIHGAKLLLSYQMPLVAACRLNTCSEKDLIPSELVKKIVQRWMCILLLLLLLSGSPKTRLETSLCISQ